jgi:hypothetical protein
MSDYPTFHCPACDCECPNWARNPDDPRCRLCHMPFEDFLDYLGPEYRREFGYEEDWEEILYERRMGKVERWQTDWKKEGF